MGVIDIEAGKLGARLRSDERGAPKAVRMAILSAAHRGRSFIVDKTPVDRGILRNAWKVMKLSDGAELVNDAPYAGIMEKGARPFKMSKEAVESLKGWVKRKILAGAFQQVSTPTLSMTWKEARAHQKMSRKKGSNYQGIKKRQLWILDDMASQIAWAIARHFAKVGMKGKRFVELALPEMAKLMDAEMSRSLDKFFGRQK